MVVMLPTEPTLLKILKRPTSIIPYSLPRKVDSHRIFTVGSGRPLPSSSQRYNSKQWRNRKAKQSEKTISPLNEHPLSPQLPAVRKYSLKLVISHADTPFKHEVVPDMEEWCPTEDDILYKIGGINLTGYFGDIILQIGLLDSVITMQPDCRYVPLIIKSVSD